MNSQPTAIMIDHPLDEKTLQDLHDMRVMRAHLTEKMLADVDQTALELAKRGLVEGETDTEELRQELRAKHADLMARMETPEVIYSDEISFYVDLLPEVEIPN